MNDVRGLRAVLAALYSAQTAVSSCDRRPSESDTGTVGEYPPEMSKDVRQVLVEIATRAQALMGDTRFEDDDRRLLEQIVDTSRRMQWLTDTLADFHPRFSTSSEDGATRGEAGTPSAETLNFMPTVTNGAPSQEYPPTCRSERMKYATWDEVAPLLTQEATTTLMGATLRGDRVAMREALDTLAALVPGGGRHEALVTFVRYLIALAGCMCEAAPEDVEGAIDVVEQLPIDALEEYAHQFACLAYTVGTAERDMTIN